jgi:hypothetical protein
MAAKTVLLVRLFIIPAVVAAAELIAVQQRQAA